MIVRPDEISASSAPSTSPLKHCEMKLAQLITLSPAICYDEIRDPAPAIGKWPGRKMRRRHFAPWARPCDGAFSAPTDAEKAIVSGRQV